MDYFKKIEKYEGDLAWNVPEKKLGAVNVIGGNAQNFKTEVRVAEFLGEKYPIESLKLVMPDALKGKLPALDNFVFLESTESGSLADEKELVGVVNAADFNLILGDLSRNSVTGRIVVSACDFAEKPLLITRDAVDLLADNLTENVLLNENLILMASLPQMIKILRAVYYPKMLLLTQSLVQVVEVLHKFTLSFPVGIVTLHEGQILVARDGEVRAVEVEKSGYAPMFFWQGEVAAKILAMNLYNPGKFIEATVAAIFQK